MTAPNLSRPRHPSADRSDLPPEFAHMPTEDDLPYDDGEPMDSGINWINMTLLRITLMRAWAGRNFYIGGDQFVYFSMDQVRTRDYKGPDVFVVLDVDPRIRKSWVLWDEGGKSPDVIIELMSPTTQHKDRVENLRIYRDLLRVPEYFWYDIDTGKLQGWTLTATGYQPMTPDAQGRLYSARLDLLLVIHESSFHGATLPWLRWAAPDGTILPTDEEAAEAERARAEAERERAEAERARAQAERERAEQAERHATEMEALLA